MSEEKLTSSFNLVQQLHFLYIGIVRARGLPGNCDPFVQVQVGSYRGTTKHFEKKANPEWKQVFAFSKERIQACSLEVFVMDKASGGIIGVVCFYVPDIPTSLRQEAPSPLWFKLADQNGRKGERSSGELMMAIWMGTQADQVFPEAWHADVANIRSQSIGDTRSKVYLSPILWYLRLNIIQAQDLVLRDKTRKPEVFVKAFLRNNTAVRSSISLDKSINPTWNNEEIMFVAAEPFDDSLILSVENRIGYDKEESLGKCAIPLSKVQKRALPVAASAEWYNLERVVREGEDKTEEKFTSRLQIRISLEGGYHVMDDSIHFSSDFRPTDKMLWRPPIGVLELGILNATGLLPMKWRNQKGTTDAYCVAKYGPKWVRTRTIVDSLAPLWHEQYAWEVYDPYTVIKIGVFDNGHLEGGWGRDGKMGKVRIRLTTLQTDRIYTHSYPLIVLQPNGVKNLGELRLALRFTCYSFTGLLSSYLQPKLPKMHYYHPLTSCQIHYLTKQATKIVSQQLSQVEPALRKEVVECMLDVNFFDKCSQRTYKANVDRINAALRGLVLAWKWFDGIQTWQNPILTILAHLIFLFLVNNPELILPTIFSYSVLVGLWSFRYRPRHPPHMDLKLSLAEKIGREALDEEFDEYPSSRQGDVLRAKYDWLRSFVAVNTSYLGEIAILMERLSSPLNWRDPRATSLVIVFCLAACIVTYFIPLKILVGAWGLFVMRHPKLRVGPPQMPLNFLARLPTRVDSML
ncbi:hypothetical protein SLEP1_g1627 [Rubroshorea leprosula]|uniref:C2 domain-containing protein n=1 Tax=Rubroshorea leprosula TaxID=152421 RepID=A0AAV5HEC9_9ROSI|nr:hypothetical protein SLEP1_g1627 [Rubroshorea leprosula]